MIYTRERRAEAAERSKKIEARTHTDKKRGKLSIKMVAVFNKELLSWYLITIKLKETVDAKQAVPSNQQPPSPPSPEAATPGLQPAEEADSDWIISIRHKLEQAGQDEEATSWAKLCIYRVPRSLRDEATGSSGEGGCDKAFTPQLVSLGPYHYNQPGLKEMDPHKWRAVRRALDRSSHDVRPYLDAIRLLEDRARSCYEGPLPLSSNQWVECMVLDGFFVLEILRGAASTGAVTATTSGRGSSSVGGVVVDGFAQLGYSRDDPVFAMRGLMHSIQRDMIMLENQLPLFVLDALLGLQIGQPEQSGLVARLAVRFFDPLNPTDEPLKMKTERIRTHLESGLMPSSASTADEPAPSFDPLTDLGGLHCLDVFRRSLLRRGPQPEPRIWIRRRSRAVRVADKRRQQLVHCVTELREAGLKICRRQTDRFWDIRFEDGVLHIPRLLIHDGTKSLFLNLIAFEQCHLDCTNNITSYVIFMDNLINSSEDVGYLHYRGIIEHWLGSDAEVADLFNRLCQEVVFDINDSYLWQLSEQVNRYYNHRWNSWKASLKHNYFGNPWAIISFVAAVVLLLLTLAQTFYGVYAYYRPPPSS